MTEFAIAAAVLALLLLGMPIIGRYHELQLATIEGARQLAFRDSWNTGTRSNPDVNALRTALFPLAEQDGQPELSALNARQRVDAAPGSAGRAARIWLAPFRLVGTSSVDLRDSGLYVTELKATVVSPATLPDPFAGLQLELSTRYELLGDNWASSGPAQVAERTRGLSLARKASVLLPLLSLGKSLLTLVEPAFRDFCPGTIDPEQVPADRLGPPANTGEPRSAGWRPAC